MFPKYRSKNIVNLSIEIGVVLVSTILPRFALLGGLPATDEGFYAYQAQLIHHSFSTGHGLPDTGPLALYPMLLSWVFEFTFNPMVSLRLADLCFAGAGTLLFYRVLAYESSSKIGGALIAIIFALTMNQPIFIQSGFKNSIAAAFVPLLLAVRISQTTQSNSSFAWVISGMLVAFSVLLRETFIPFALLGFVVLLITRGRYVAFRYALGGMAASLLVIGSIILARGGMSHLIESYRSLAVIYSAMENQRTSLFLSNGLASVKEANVALSLSALAVIAVTIKTCFSKDHYVARRLFFWLIVVAVALIEPLSKIGFPYHFSVCLIGFSGICALAWRQCENSVANRRWLVLLLGTVVTVFLIEKYSLLVRNWSTTRELLMAAPSGSWPADEVSRSNYLLAAKAIRNVIPDNGTLSISGSMLALYPLTGHLPPCAKTENLTATFISLGFSESRLSEILNDCAPDVIMTTSRTDLPGSLGLLAAVEATGRYKRVAEIPVVGSGRSYGGFGGYIYRKSTDR